MTLSTGKVLVFLLTCLACIGLFSFVAEKWTHGSDTICFDDHGKMPCLRFYTLAEITGIPLREKMPEISPVEEMAAKYSSERAKDTITHESVLAPPVTDSCRFWLPAGENNYWDEIFSEWDNLESNKSLYRILHMGDSQIEMDRITAIIRERLQKKFGGSGPGWLPMVQLIPTYTIFQESSENWHRYICYGLPDDKASNNHYGLSGMLFRFDSTARVQIAVRGKSKSPVSHFETTKVLVGRSGGPLTVSIYTKNGHERRVIKPSETEQIEKWDLPVNSSSVSLTFHGDTTSSILGVAIDGNYGIAVDNIPWRGSSGLTFTSISRSSLKQTYRLLDTKMIILQFGGNSVPYLKTQKAIDEYIRGFKKQLVHLKSVDSTLKILVIGPADMSYNNKGTMETYPLLETVIDAMRKASLSSGAAFWSMYDAMGGRNSMARWVKMYPALGAPDYIHFTQKGSEVIADKFNTAMDNVYESYRKQKLTNAK